MHLYKYYAKNLCNSVENLTPLRSDYCVLAKIMCLNQYNYTSLGLINFLGEMITLAKFT